MSPFYSGQRIVAVNALPGSAFINGQEYICSDCLWMRSSNPIAKGKYFWYIGVVGHSNGGCYYRQSIFAPIPEMFQEVTFEKIKEINPVSVN